MIVEKRQLLCVPSKDQRMRLYGGLVLRPNWGFWIMPCIVGLLVAWRAYPVVIRILCTARSGENVTRLMKILKWTIYFLFICTGVFFVATYAVGMAGASTENAVFLARFPKLWYCSWVSLCATCAATFLLFLVWAAERGKIAGYISRLRDRFHPEQQDQREA